MEKVSAFLNRKVFGIKVLYLLAAGVIALAVVAYVMKPKDDELDEEVSDTDLGDATGDEAAEVSDDAMTAFPSTDSGGTVNVMPPQDDGSDAINDSIQSNETWLTRGVSFLVSKGVPGTAAQQALQTYLTGKQLSITQKNQVDQVIAEYGLPPMGTESPQASGTPKRLRYIQAPNSSYYAQYDNGTLVILPSNEWRAMGKPEVQMVSANDPVWELPTYDSKGELMENANRNQPHRNPYTVGYVRFSDPQSNWIYAIRSHGVKVGIRQDTWKKDYASKGRTYKTVSRKSELGKRYLAYETVKVI